MRSMLVGYMAILLSYVLHRLLEDAGLSLPLFVPCPLMGIVMSDTAPYVLPRLTRPSGSKALAIISDISLSVFLAMSLMSMQLWTLAKLGGPLVAVLAMQVLRTVCFVGFIVFRVIGMPYTAAGLRVFY